MLFLSAVFPGRRKTESIRRFFSRGCLTGKNGLWRLREGGVPDDPHGRHAGNVLIPSPGYGQAEWHYRGDGEQGGGRTRLPGFPDGADAIQCRVRIVSRIGHRR